MNTATKEDRVAKPELIRKCWAYLDDNFHKFSETNKIKISLELCKKDMPTTLEGSGLATQIINIMGNGKSQGLINRLENRIENRTEVISGEIPI